MKNPLIILEAMFLYVLYKMGFMNPSITTLVEQRKHACEHCILRKGNWCSAKKVTMVYNDFINPYGAKQGKMIIKGCGCFLPFKWLSDMFGNPCPLKKWDKLK